MQNTSSGTIRRGLRLSVLPVFMILSACADEGGGFVPGAPTFDLLGSERDILQSQFTVGSGRLDPLLLPPSGDFVYNGVVSLVLDDASTINPGSDLEMRGDMTVTASFSNVGGTLSGTASSFSDSDFGTYTGSLDITANIIKDAGVGEPSILGGIGGGLTNDSTGVLFTLEGTGGLGPNALLEGDFYEPNQLFIGGTITGQVRTPDDTTYRVGTGAPIADSGGFVGGQ